MTQAQTWSVPGGLAGELSLANDMIQVHLPFPLDPQAVSAQLMREGYPLAHEPALTPDTQGWGNDFDANGYYPYWVFPDDQRPGRYVFAFYPNPEDVVRHTANTRPVLGPPNPKTVERLNLGERSQRVVERWVPVLARLQHEQMGGDDTRKGDGRPVT